MISNHRALVAAVLLVLAGPLAAQSVPATLTLSDALAIARERNPQYRQALNQLNTASADIRAGIGAFLPRVDASMGWSLNNSRTVSGSDDYGRAVSLPNPIDFQSSSASQSVRAGLTLFDGLNNFNTYRATRASSDATEANAEYVLRQVQAETTRRFYDALRTQRLIAVEQQLLASSREQQRNTEALFRAAAATQDDLLGTQADVARQDMAVQRAIGDADKARLALKEQLGIAEDVDFTVEGELPAVFDPTALDPDSLVQVARGLSPQLHQLQAQADAAHLRATAAHGQRWPSVSLSASYGRSMSLSSYAALWQLNPQNRGFGFSINMSLPLFTGFQTSAQIAQANVQAHNADETLTAGEIAVERSVRSALIDLQIAHRGLAVAQQAADLSRQRLQFARERYALGSLTFTNLQQIITAANQDERQVVTARFQLATSVVNLEEVVGTGVRP